MKAILLALIFALLMIGFCGGCSTSPQELEEYEADRKAYYECLQKENNSDNCTFDYVKYLPPEILKEMN